MRALKSVVISLMFLVFLAEAKSLRGESAEPLVDFSTPTHTYLTYLQAVKRNDLDVAKQCWSASGEFASEFVTVLLELQITQRRFADAITVTLGEHGKPYIEEAYSDAAIDRTIERVRTSHATIIGNRAELPIHWREGDGSEVIVFEYNAAHPVFFQDIQGAWKIDGDAMVEWEKSYNESLSAPGQFEAILHEGRFYLRLLKRQIDGLQKDQIRTLEELEEVREQTIQDILKQDSVSPPFPETMPELVRTLLQCCRADYWETYILGEIATEQPRSVSLSGSTYCIPQAVEPIIEMGSAVVPALQELHQHPQHFLQWELLETLLTLMTDEKVTKLHTFVGKESGVPIACYRLHEW